jgi:hypothetical protein
MGDGDHRNSKRTAKLDGRELKRLSELSARNDAGGASGSDAQGAELPSLGRTVTLDDPFTTSLLAEVTRRSQTIEVSDAQIAEASELATGDRAPGEPPVQRSAASGDRSGDPT